MHAHLKKFRKIKYHSKPVHWDNPEGLDGEGIGRWVRMGEHMYTQADSCQCMAKNTTILQNN